MRSLPLFLSSAKPLSSTAAEACTDETSNTAAERQSAVRVFLASALSPHVQAASRWVAVSALSRRAFALAGKDTSSPVLDWLSAGRPEGAGGQFAGAARQLGVDRLVNGTRYLAWYRRLNHGYPFLDYSSGAGMAADTQLMAAYAAQSDAPGPSTTWSGPREELPSGQVVCGDRQAPSTELLAGWLRIAAGITHVRRLTHSTIAFRTSPSGGARHPTDVAVGVGLGWPEPVRGAWWYDPLDHALVRADDPIPRPVPDAATDVVFAVTSHVARAMWRYRDVRAFRPVLIDAGHVVETLLIAIRAAGWGASWHPAPGFAADSGHLDPVLGYVVASDSAQAPHMSTAPTWLPMASADTPAASTPLRANPLISVSVTPSALRVENHLRGGAGLVATSAVLDALAYSTPSSRADRPSTAAEICGATGIDVRTLETLVQLGFLLDEDTGDRLWRLARAWFQHDWLLSLLAHAEESSHTRGPIAGAGPIARPSADLPVALDRRRTCRAMTGNALPVEAVDRLLGTARLAPSHVQVVAILRHDVPALPAGSYLLDGGRWRASADSTPSDEQVRAMAIGQPWAHGFDTIFLLVPSPGNEPGTWEQALIDCGRVAQQLALAVCADPSIGVFQSPALVDDMLSSVLKLDDSLGGSLDGAYLVGVGVARDAASDTEHAFRPSQVMGVEKASDR